MFILKLSDGNKRLVSNISMVLFILILSTLTYSKIPINYPIVKDAKENTTASYHLMNNGVISMDGVNKTHFREPLPIAVLAVHMAFFTDVKNDHADITQITTTPKYIKQINIVNLYYVIPTFFILWWLAWLLTKSHLLSALVVFFSWTTFFVRAWHLGRPLSEYAACLFLLIIALITIRLFRQSPAGSIRQTYLICFLLGVVIGLFALTKAVGFYVGILVAPIIAVLLYYLNKFSFINGLKFSLMIYLGLFLVVSPWLLRNVFIEDVSGLTSAITARGGSVILLRANFNHQVGGDAFGGIYAFSPPVIQKELFEKYFGFRAKDLWFGGKYENLNRNLTYIKNANTSAIEQVNVKADASETRQALEIITSAFSKHVVASFVFAWRGIWSFDGGNHLRPGGKSNISVIFNFASFIAFIVFPLIAIFKKNKQWLAFSVFPFFIFVFYAFFSHFIPRYSAPLIPFSILSLALLLQASIVNFKKSF